jgi:hypothetical protein
MRAIYDADGFSRRRRPLEIRRGTFREGGMQHQLLVLTDLSGRCAKKNAQPGRDYYECLVTN